MEIARHLDAAKLTLTPRSASNVDDPAVFGVNPKFCVNAKLWCKIEQKYFKAGAAQAAAAFSTKTTALRGNVKGGGVSLRSSRLLTFRLQPVSPACGRQRTPPTVRELRSSLAADVHGGGHMVGVLHTQHLLLAAGIGVAGSRPQIRRSLRLFHRKRRQNCSGCRCWHRWSCQHCRPPDLWT